MHATLFKDEAPNAQRQPKTDRLILPRYLTEAIKTPEIAPVRGDGPRTPTDAVKSAHAIIVKWADLESSGQLAQMHETQLQGEFFGDIFGRALGYRLFSEGEGAWTLEQHHTIGGSEPDAVLGHFRSGETRKPLAVVELKGPRIHLDRDRSNGRTAIQQLWQYMVNTERECRWGIASNMVCFRLYERDSTQRRYEHFSLQSLRNIDTFSEFYCLFHAKGLIERTAGRHPRALELLEKSNNRQREVGDELYERYSRHRTYLIDHLHREQGYTIENAIEIVQRLLDRVIFVAFCEDRGLLREETIRRAYSELPAFHVVTNPRWQNFKALFRFLDRGNETQGVPEYNGGLFAKHEADDIELDDKWTHFFNTLGGYDFADEVNLDVLGHLFEKSITELEKLRSSALFEGGQDAIEQYARMPQSIKRKQLGIYYTPQELTSRIVQYTVDELIEERLAALGDQANAGADYWESAIAMMRRLKIIDPACGSGAFLFQAYEVIEHRYHEAISHLDELGRHAEAHEHTRNVPSYILNDNLYGVDLSPEAVEITQLALWIRSATPGQTLATLSRNIVHGNSLVHDSAVHPAGFDWRERFSEVFGREEDGFDCVIGNPPWERIKQQKREFFSLVPEVILEPHPAKARALIDSFAETKPELLNRWREALQGSEQLSQYLRRSDCYSRTARGDINTYAVFTELAAQIVSPNGRVGLLVPSGIASDTTTRRFFSEIVGSDRLIRLYDFENKKVFFPEVHASFKFCILGFGGRDAQHGQADYVFFAHGIEDLEVPRRHITLSARDIELFNPETRTSPIFRTVRDAELARSIYQRIAILHDTRRETTGNPWGVRFWTMFHQSGDAEHFRNARELSDAGLELADGHWLESDGSRFLQVYEAKMVQAYDHRATSVETKTSNWLRHGQKAGTSLVEHQNPEYRVLPRWWAAEHAVEDHASDDRPWFIAFKDISSATNQRTMIASVLPRVGVTHHLPLIATELSARRSLCLLANLNAFVYDFCARQKLGGTTFGFYHLRQLPTLPPDTYDKPCPWQRNQTLEEWTSERVLKLSCTAKDMLPLAEACDFTAGSFKNEYNGRLHKWDPADRANLMAELDAAYFILYGIERDDAEYILRTFSGVVDPNPLLPGHRSTAQHILETYDMLRMQST